MSDTPSKAIEQQKRPPKGEDFSLVTANGRMRQEDCDAAAAVTRAQRELIAGELAHGAVTPDPNSADDDE